MRRRVWVSVLLLLFLAGAGCAPESTSQGEGSASTAAPSPSPVSEAVPPPSPAPAPEPAVRLAFVGDILLGGGLDGVLQYRGVDHPWVYAGPILRAADLSIGNLETSVTRGGTPAPNKQFTFRSRPETMAGVSQAGLDVLTLANNHSRDYGPDALVDTVRHVREAGIYPVGAGADAAEAARPVFVELNGLKLAVLGFSRVIPEVGWVAGGAPGVNPGWDPKPTVAAVRGARQQADAVIVVIHWGEELHDEPRPVDVDLAHDLLAAGATLVVGHHPHILQGIERNGPGLVAYSLGNFVFTSGSNPLTAETGILEATVTRAGVQEARFVPMVIREGQPRPAERGARRRILERLDRLSQRWQTAVSADGTVTATNPPGGRRPRPAAHPTIP